MRNRQCNVIASEGVALQEFDNDLKAGMNIDRKDLSGFQCTLIDGKLQRLGGVQSGNGGEVRRLEPAILFDLVIGHCGQRRFGAHDDDSLEFAFDFSGFAPDKKFTDIKFRHVAAFPWKLLLFCKPSGQGRLSLVGQYGSSCLPTAELSRRHDETSMEINQARPSASRLECTGEGAGFVMIAAETSYMASGNFLDVEEGVAGQHDLKTRGDKRFRVKGN